MTYPASVCGAYRTAAFVFMFRMADVVEISSGVKLVDDETDDEPSMHADSAQRAHLPKGVEVFQIAGPLFFGASNRLDNLLDQFYHPPKAFILRMRLVPIIDASGVHALKTLADRCRHRGIVLIVSGLQAKPKRVIEKMNLQTREGQLHFVADFEAALTLAKTVAGASLVEDIAGV